MKALKKIPELVIYGNFWISFGAALMVWETYLLLDLKPDALYIFFTFAATLSIYNLDRLVILKENLSFDNERLDWIKRNARLMTAITALCIIFMGISIFFMPVRVLLFLAHLGLISIAYSIPFIKTKEGKRVPLRSLHGLKIFLIAYVWMAATGWLPAVEKGLPIFDPSVFSVALRRGLFIFAITIPFDIRDMKTDADVGIKTIPTMIGVKTSQWLSVLSLIIFVFLAALDHSLVSPAFWALLFSALTTAPLTFLAKEEFDEYFYTGLLDGTIVIQFLLVWAFRYFW